MIRRPAACVVEDRVCTPCTVQESQGSVKGFWKPCNLPRGVYIVSTFHLSRNPLQPPAIHTCHSVPTPNIILVELGRRGVVIFFVFSLLPPSFATRDAPSSNSVARVVVHRTLFMYVIAQYTHVVPISLAISHAFLNSHLRTDNSGRRNRSFGLVDSEGDSAERRRKTSRNIAGIKIAKSSLTPEAESEQVPCPALLQSLRFIFRLPLLPPRLVINKMPPGEIEISKKQT